MKKLTDSAYELDLDSLDAVSGGISAAVIGALRPQQQPFGMGVGTPMLGPTYTPSLTAGVVSPFGVGLANDLLGFSQQAALFVNQRHAPVAINANTFNAANVLAARTNGAIAFHENGDGRISAEDFLHRGGVNEGVAAQAVGGMLDQLRPVAAAAAAPQIPQANPLQQVMPLLNQLTSMFRGAGAGQAPRPSAGQAPQPSAGQGAGQSPMRSSLTGDPDSEGSRGGAGGSGGSGGEGSGGSGGSGGGAGGSGTGDTESPGAASNPYLNGSNPSGSSEFNGYGNEAAPTGGADSNAWLNGTSGVPYTNFNGYGNEAAPTGADTNQYLNGGNTAAQPDNGYGNEAAPVVNDAPIDQSNQYAAYDGGSADYGSGDVA